MTAAPAAGTANVIMRHLRALVRVHAHVYERTAATRANGNDVQTHTRNPPHFTGNRLRWSSRTLYHRDGSAGASVARAINQIDMSV